MVTVTNCLKGGTIERSRTLLAHLMANVISAAESTEFLTIRPTDARRQALKPDPLESLCTEAKGV